MTTPAAWPSVVAALVTLADTGGDVRVTRGRDTTNETGDFIMVGVSDIDESPWDDAGSFDQEFHTFGGARSETGTVNIVALSRNGDADAATACTDVFALVTELTTAVRADPTLGVTGFDYLVAEIHSGNVRESENEEGAMASVSLTVSYQARIA